MLATFFVRAVALTLPSLLLAALLPTTASAQWLCDGRGTVARASAIEDGPALGCAFAPDAPAFRILAPAFHDITPREGWRLVAARARPRLIARYRCTGLWLLPVVLHEVAIYGQVLDVTATPCEAIAPAHTPG